MVSRSIWSIIFSILVIIIELFSSRLQFLSQRLFGVTATRSTDTLASKMMTTSSTTDTNIASGAAGISTTAALSLFDETKPETPVYFFSHGGPTFMYPESEFGSDIGAYEKVQSVGRFIQNKIKPNFIIVVSAHWQSNSGTTIEIGISNSSKNVFNSKSSPGLLDPNELDLIYDFYGFPDHMYRENFHSKGSLELAQDIQNTLTSNSLKSNITPRGIDHGVWVPFKVAFSTNKPADKKWDLDCPLIQVSLTGSDSFDIHHKLGEALSKYRKLGGLIICSGMSVHNLRDLGISISQGGKVMPYVSKFNELLTSVISGSTGDERLKKLKDIQTEQRQLLYRAHPSLEHLMPIIVASGAGSDEKAQELYNSASLSLGWGVYQFGDYKQEKL